MTPTAESIKEIIASLDLLDVAELKNDVAFGDQGIDSMDRASIYFEVEDKYGVKLPENEEEQYGSIEGLIKFVSNS